MLIRWLIRWLRRRRQERRAELATEPPARRLRAAAGAAAGTSLTGFDPGARAPGIARRHLLVVGAWGLGGLFVAVRRFAWTPS